MKTLKKAVVFFSGLMIIFAILLAGCGGGGSSTPSGGGSSTPPYIASQVVTWAGGIPSGAPVLQAKVCTDNTCNNPITNATVTINSTILTYNSSKNRYEASSGAPAAGSAVNLAVIIPSGDPVAAGTYTASGTQYTTFPSITSSANWLQCKNNSVTWTAGSPAASEYIVGIMDSNGHFYPAFGDTGPVEVSISSLTYPADINPAGVYTVFVGIATNGFVEQTSGGISISGAASGSGLWIGGISALQTLVVDFCGL